MKHLKFALTAILTLAIIGTATAKKTELKLNLEKGSVYEMKFTMENSVNQKMMGKDISIKQDILMVSETEVTDVLDNGNFMIKQSYSDMDFTMNMNGKETNMDSLAQNPLNAIKEAIITYEVTRDGVVSNIKGLESLAQQVGTNAQLAGLLKGILNSEILTAFYSYLPKEPVKVGDSYEVKLNNAELMNMETTTVYTVKEITKEDVILDVSMDMDMDAGKNFQQNGMDMSLLANGKQTGDFVVSKKDGMPISSKVLMEMNMEISFKNPQNDETINMPMKMNMKSNTMVTKK